MKAVLTKLWQEQANARNFLQQAKKAGYVVTNGYGRTPYMVVDDTGQSFNLVRHLDGVKLKEVRERFQETVLPEEKDTISFIRTQEAVTGQRSAKARQKIRSTEQYDKATDTREAFMENLARMKASQQSKLKGPRMR